jgi:predicted nucleic acid-binding protein
MEGQFPVLFSWVKGKYAGNLQGQVSKKIEANAYTAAHGAAQIFRKLRQRGITIRAGGDCLIAWYALHAGCALLHGHRDFDLMKKPLGLKVLR